MFKYKSVLITGGTGSFGKKCLAKLVKISSIKRIVIFSRDELKQHDLMQKYPAKKYPSLRFFLGDVRDRYRLISALEGIDLVIHAAALKQVPSAEYNPYEFIKTNVLGANNLIEACIDQNVKKVISLSTDKAAAPVNLYGATKLCSDKLFISANNIVGNKKQSFSIVRYGNVMMSRGSVIPIFLKNKKKHLNITDPRMTRFNITLDQAVNFVLEVVKKSIGGEIFVPKLPSYNIMDLANAVSEKCKKKIIGIRDGEKIHEEMITKSDSHNTIESKNFFIILPNRKKMDKYLKIFNAKKIIKPFSYNSYNNDRKLNISDLRLILKKFVNDKTTKK